MITKIAQEELNKIKPTLEKIDDYHYKITKSEPVVLELVDGHIYIICLEDYIINPTDNFTLSSNWNAGIVPKSKYMMAQLMQRVGKMLQFDGIGYDISTGEYKEDVYKGLWLPQGGIQIIKEVRRDEV